MSSLVWRRAGGRVGRRLFGRSPLAAGALPWTATSGAPESSDRRFPELARRALRTFLASPPTDPATGAIHVGA